MTPTPLRPDWRDPRDWRRPWRDPPGFFSCCCDDCVPACTPGTATVGNVGSESGDECTDCTNQIFFDDFSGSSLVSNGWLGSPSSSGCGAAGLDNPFDFRISGGTLIAAGPGVLYREFPRPALAGFCVQVSAKIVSHGTNLSAALTIGYGRWFAGRIGLGNSFARHAGTTGYGCISVLNFATFGPAPSNGDSMSLRIRDQGGADAVCTVCYKVNSSVIRVEEDVQFCFPCTMIAGIAASTNNTVMDDFEIRTS